MARSLDAAPGEQVDRPPSRRRSAHAHNRRLSTDISRHPELLERHSRTELREHAAQREEMLRIFAAEYDVVRGLAISQPLRAGESWIAWYERMRRSYPKMLDNISLMEVFISGGFTAFLTDSSAEPEDVFKGLRTEYAALQRMASANPPRFGETWTDWWERMRKRYPRITEDLDLIEVFITGGFLSFLMDPIEYDDSGRAKSRAQRHWKAHDTRPH